MKNKKMIIGMIAAIAVVALCVIGLLITLKPGVHEQFSSERAYRTEEEVKNFDDSMLDATEDFFITDDFTGSDHELRQKIFDAYTILNDKRKEQGRKALRWDARFEDDAFRRAGELPERFDHTRPDGMAWFTINAKELRAENIYKGYDDPEKVMESWMKNAPDGGNFLSEEFTRGAFGIFELASGDLYWVALFGSDEDGN